MKRYYSKLLLVCSLALLIGGCGKDTNLKNNVGVTPTNEVNEQITEAVGEKEDVTSNQSEEEKDADESNATESATTQGETYTWNEITIQIPLEWKDKYLIKTGEQGFSLYQKASYDKLEGSGFLCGFERLDELFYDLPGVSLLAYTKDYMYVMTLPTDISYYYEDEKISEEFLSMNQQIEDIESSMQIQADEVHYDAEEYVLAMSEYHLLTEDDLINRNDNELCLGRNEIFARHGYKFKDYYLQAYFNTCTWYEGTVEADQFDESVFSDIEKANLEAIKERELNYQAEHPYPKSEKVGTLVQVDLDGDGTKEKLKYSIDEVNNRTESKGILNIDGKEYNLEDYGVYLCYPMTDKFYLTDISEFFDGIEIAVLDYGPSNDQVANFLTYDGDLHYIGGVPGFTFREEGNLNGFADGGCVVGVIRTDIIESCYSYASWWYDYENKQLVFQDTGYYKMLPTDPHQLLVELPVYQTMSEDSKQSTIEAGKFVYFMVTDGKEWIQVKTKDGKMGYVHLNGNQVADLKMDATEVFTDLQFFD